MRKNKFDIEYFSIFFAKCNFFFYKESWKCKSMHGGNTYYYYFCIPFVIGFVRKKSWGWN